MDTVTHDGKEYKKVAVLAEEFNYTTDYIGQLCRAGKVDARLVGRAWYVYPESLKHHKKNRYQDTVEKRLKDSNEGADEKNYEKRVDVDVLRTKKTTKIHKDYEGGYREVSINYESDDGSLLPRVEKPEQDPTPVVPADATQLKVKPVAKKPGPINLTPTELPKVYLKGKVPVAAVHERADLPVQKVENKPRSRTRTSEISPVPQKLSFKERVQQSRENADIVEKPSHLGQNFKQNRPQVAQKSAQRKEQQLKPKAPVEREKDQKITKRDDTNQEKVPTRSVESGPSRLLTTLLVLIALLVAVAVIGLRADVVAENEKVSTEWFYEVPW